MPIRLTPILTTCRARPHATDTRQGAARAALRTREAGFTPASRHIVGRLIRFEHHFFECSHPPFHRPHTPL